MLELERFNRNLKLSVLFSFFLYMLTFVLIICLSNLSFMLYDTFLSSFTEMVDLFLILILKILKYTATLFFIGSIIGLIVIFLNDYLTKPTQMYKT